MKSLLKFFTSKSVRLLTSVLLLLAALMDLRETALEEFLNVDIKIHHGIILFSITEVFQSIGEIVLSRAEKTVKT